MEITKFISIKYYLFSEITTFYLHFLSFRDVLSQGLKQEITLVGSNNYDAILCSLVADLDLDGQNEIILGSYGQVSVVEIN